MGKQLDFKIIASDHSGSVTTMINGIKYIYHIDALHLKSVLTTTKRAPGKALSMLKKLDPDPIKVDPLIGAKI